MVMACCDKQAACRGVGAVDEDLVVDSVRVRGIRDIDKPKGFKPAVESPPAYSLLLSELRQRRCRYRVAVEGAEVPGLGMVSSLAR